MKSDRKTLLSGKPKWEEGRKAAPQPHPVHLCEVGQRESASSRVEKVNSVRSCPLSIKILCHNLQWNFGYLFGHFFALKLLHVWLWMQPENGGKQIWKKSNWEIQLSENPKLVAELSQTGGRQKSSSTAAPSALVRGWSMRKCEITCGESQFCAELSTFNENFCHNLPWKKNSPGTDPSFSRGYSGSCANHGLNIKKLGNRYQWVTYLSVSLKILELMMYLSEIYVRKHQLKVN